MRAIITGGGTGGHVYPALAIVDALKDMAPNIQLLYVGSMRGMERDLVRGIPAMQVRFLEVSGLVRKHPRDMLTGVVRALRAWWRARGLVKSFRPDVIIGTGGYVSGPVVLAGAQAGVPVVLQEQNAYPGMTNRWLARWAAHVCVAFAPAQPFFARARAVTVTGNPVRQEFARLERRKARESLGVGEDERLLLIAGGSLGAQVIADTALALLRHREWDERNKVLLATGKNYYDYIMEEMHKSSIKVGENGNVMVRPYIHDMPTAMVAADLALCRAGAVTVSELAVCGLPAVLIPSPNVAHNEQEYNARVLVDAGAGVMITEEGSKAAQAALPVVMELLQDRSRMELMRKKCLEQAKPDAARTIARIALECATKRLP